MKEKDVIKDKMIELMLLDIWVRLDGYTLERLIEEYYERAVKAVKPLERSCLTPNQRLRLKEKIDEIELATGRTYVALTYQDKNAYLSYVDSMGYYRPDTFTDFLSFMDSAFEPGKLYLLSDLLGETE